MAIKKSEVGNCKVKLVDYKALTPNLLTLQIGDIILCGCRICIGAKNTSELLDSLSYLYEIYANKEIKNFFQQRNILNILKSNQVNVDDKIKELINVISNKDIKNEKLFDILCSKMDNESIIRYLQFKEIINRINKIENITNKKIVLIGDFNIFNFNKSNKIWCEEEFENIIKECSDENIILKINNVPQEKSTIGRDGAKPDKIISNCKLKFEIELDVDEYYESIKKDKNNEYFEITNKVVYNKQGKINAPFPDHNLLFASIDLGD